MCDSGVLAWHSGVEIEGWDSRESITSLLDMNSNNRQSLFSVRLGQNAVCQTEIGLIHLTGEHDRRVDTSCYNLLGQQYLCKHCNGSQNRWQYGLYVSGTDLPIPCVVSACCMEDLITNHVERFFVWLMHSYPTERLQRTLEANNMTIHPLIQIA